MDESGTRGFGSGVTAGPALRPQASGSAVAVPFELPLSLSALSKTAAHLQQPLIMLGEERQSAPHPQPYHLLNPVCLRLHTCSRRRHGGAV